MLIKLFTNHSSLIGTTRFGYTNNDMDDTPTSTKHDGYATNVWYLKSKK